MCMQSKQQSTYQIKKDTQWPTLYNNNYQNNKTMKNIYRTQMKSPIHEILNTNEGIPNMHGCV